MDPTGYTDWLIRILGSLLMNQSPCNWVVCHPLCTANNQGQLVTAHMSSKPKQKPTALTFVNWDSPPLLPGRWIQSSKIKAKPWKHVCHVTICTNYMFCMEFSCVCCNASFLLILRVINCCSFEPLSWKPCFLQPWLFHVLSVAMGQKIRSALNSATIPSCTYVEPCLNIAKTVEIVKVKVPFTKNAYPHCESQGFGFTTISP